MNRSMLLSVSLAAALALAACAGPEEPADGAPAGSSAVEPASAPDVAVAAVDDGNTLVAHKKIFDVRTEGTRRTRRHVGWLEHRFPVDDPQGGQYFVSDVDHVRLGFVLPAGQAFRYVVRNGEITDTEALGPGGLNGGIVRVLGVNISEVELAPIGPPPVSR